MVRQGFLSAKAFLAVVREGVADKPGDILCSVFLFCLEIFGLAWEPGGAGILFFFTGILLLPHKKNLHVSFTKMQV